LAAQLAITKFILSSECLQEGIPIGLIEVDAQASAFIPE
jgi:hypothetical protein